ncbi:MAG: GntR family transcriptional regulator [Fusobacterium sp. JB019]|nr:GntR family transcriptional regulator [Fusobacterium sp. JB019]MDP0506556.1 GntR family transcriptional regulator [Fusobacterium sp. JB019]
MINKNSSVPLYIQLEILIKDYIKTKEINQGEIIPSENELSKKYKISRMTVKKALDNLEIKGIVERKKGIGTFVKFEEKKIELPLNKINGFSEKVISMGLTPENEVLKFEEKHPEYKISKALDIQGKEKVWYMERLRKVEGVAAVFEKSYIRKKILPNLKKKDLYKSKFNYIELKGLEIEKSEREIIAKIPEDDIANILELKRNEPVLVAESVTYLKNGEILEYSEIFYNQRKYKFKLIART